MSMRLPIKQDLLPACFFCHSQISLIVVERFPKNFRDIKKSKLFYPFLKQNDFLNVPFAIIIIFSYIVSIIIRIHKINGYNIV